MTPQLLSAATGCGLLRAATYAAHIDAAMGRWGINTPLRQAAFIGQIAHESGRFSSLEENLNYTAERLTVVWPGRFPTIQAARPFANNAAALAEKVYSGRMGNNVPGDGFAFRGRGLIHLTGREDYAAYTMAANVDALTSPGIVATPEFAADSAAWFWSDKRCNGLADRQDWAALTNRINGGTTGLSERIAYINKALALLGAR